MENRNKTDISKVELEERITAHSERLGIIKECFSLLSYCLVNDAYSKTKTELFDFGIVLEEYIINTKKEFTKLEDDLISTFDL